MILYYILTLNFLSIKVYYVFAYNNVFFISYLCYFHIKVFEKRIPKLKAIIFDLNLIHKLSKLNFKYIEKSFALLKDVYV